MLAGDAAQERPYVQVWGVKLGFVFPIPDVFEKLSQAFLGVVRSRYASTDG